MTISFCHSYLEMKKTMLWLCCKSKSFIDWNALHKPSKNDVNSRQSTVVHKIYSVIAVYAKHLNESWTITKH